MLALPIVVIMKLSRAIKTQLGAALILVVLGAGNLIFGEHKVYYYEELVKEAEKELTLSQNIESTRRKRPSALLFPKTNIDSQTRHLSKLRARLQYYELTQRGGAVFLAAAGILLLFSLVSLRSEKRQDELNH